MLDTVIVILIIALWSLGLFAIFEGCDRLTAFLCERRRKAEERPKPSPPPDSRLLRRLTVCMRFPRGDFVETPLGKGFAWGCDGRNVYVELETNLGYLVEIPIDRVKKARSS